MKWMNKLYQAGPWRMVFSIVLFVLAMMYLLPMMSDATGNIVTPDSDFWYNSQRLSEIGDTYQLENVRAYAITRFTYDVIWPLIYGFFMVSTIGFMTRDMKKGRMLNILYSLPLLAVVADFIENTTCSMFFYNMSVNVTGIIAPIASSIKWVLILVIFTLQGILLLWSIINFFRSKLS